MLAVIPARGRDVLTGRRALCRPDFARFTRRLSLVSGGADSVPVRGTMAGVMAGMVSSGRRRESRGSVLRSADGPVADIRTSIKAYMGDGDVAECGEVPRQVAVQWHSDEDLQRSDEKTPVLRSFAGSRGTDFGFGSGDGSPEPFGPWLP